MFPAALSIASKNPRERSSGVVGDFPVVIRPPSCMIVQSVKVPPMSTPIGQTRRSSCRHLGAQGELHVEHGRVVGLAQLGRQRHAASGAEEFADDERVVAELAPGRGTDAD